ncbi:MAG: FtsX-like permease family protein [Bacteriovoracaceae bacterium]|nr:FtsX-like permease family protein [Bacteriovoracaceae bacterium]
MKFKFFFVKEMKKFPFFFLLLFFTLLLGTMGLVGISIITGQVQEKLQNNANELLTSDIAISARRDLFPLEQESLFKILNEYPHRHYKIIDIYSMISNLRTGTTRLAEIRATEKGFPFYGKMTLKNGEFESDQLYISKDLADLWQVQENDELQIGELVLKVSGVVEEDSSMGLRGFSLAPRIYLPLSKLLTTGLLKPGATGGFAYHFKLNDLTLEKVQRIKTSIYKVIKDSAVRITLPEDSSEQTGRVINTLTNFMALSALIGLILSLVGVFYLYQSHLLARLKDLCLLNLHGLTKREIIVGIIAQFSFIFFLVVVVELLFIIPLYKTLAPVLSTNLGIELSPEVNVASALTEIPFLFGLSLFILVPLLLGLMRTPMGLQLKASKLSMGRFRFWDFMPFIVSLWLFSCYLGHSFRNGSLFFISLLMVFLLSTLVVRGGQWILRKFIKNKGLLLPTIENGIALRSLSRSGHKLTLSFLSLAMGATLISLILQLDKMILKEFALDENKPSLFIFDIQEEQMEPLVSHAREQGAPLAYITPMIRARLEKVNDKKFVRKKRSYDFRSREDDEENRFRSNTLNLTYRDYLTGSEKIISGKPFPQGGAPDDRLPYVSLEKRWAQRMDLEIGDKLTFDIQGVEFEGQVHNIREVKWTTFYPNFFVTIEPSLIEAAPKTFLAVLPAGPKETKLTFQRSTVEKFPNISFIDVEELIGKLSGLFVRARQAIEVISWLSLAVGLVILYGLSHDQVYRRYYDLALMKSLGFSSTRLRLNLLYEFGVLFLSAMTLGLFLGWMIAQIVGREVFKLALSVDWDRLLYPAGLLTILCLVTIMASSWRAVRARPRELLSDS